MAVKINDFEIKDLEVKVEKDKDTAEVVATNGVDVFKKALEDAGVDFKEYQKAYKFDQAWVDKLVHWSADKAEEIFKEDGSLENIEFKLPLSHKSEDPSVKRHDALEVLVVKNKEVRVAPGSDETKMKTAIQVKARTHRYSFSDAERKRLEESLRNKILGD